VQTLGEIRYFNNPKVIGRYRGTYERRSLPLQTWKVGWQ
jgi:hypothetical protein